MVGKSFIRQSAAGRLKSKNICKIAPYPLILRIYFFECERLYFYHIQFI
nr:MAG TPA: hypothetical protein [Caudoviricetes sp.]